jgi:hypothetical protein
VLYHQGGMFSNVRVDLDNQTYEGCAFDGCNIVFSGNGPYQLSNCTFNNCRFGFEGAAALTLKFLSDIYKANPHPVEEVFTNVRLANVS